MHKILFASLVALGPIPSQPGAVEKIDLSGAVIVRTSSKTIHVKAAEMLRDEIDKRTRIGLDVVTEMPGEDKPAIVLGTDGVLPELPADLELPQKADAYALWVSREGVTGPRVYLVGCDDRGVLYAAGRLLRLLEMNRDRLMLDSSIKISTAPVYRLRGHQFPYRPKVNTYDGWTISMWEQYCRDMVVFGMNAIELMPPGRSDDDDDSPHFPKPKMEMDTALSQMADDYGLEVWIWWPLLETTMEGAERALPEREETFRTLPRIDAILLAGGDPGEAHPSVLMRFGEMQKEILKQYHPDAQMWVSPQTYERVTERVDRTGWLGIWYNMLKTEQPEWLDGVVFGAQVPPPLRDFRREVPARYPVRRYPDITHTYSSHYPVPNWDPAYRLTLGREPINPQPRRMAHIFRNYSPYSIGFITYSEGVNDDLNKVVWASLGWDPDTNIEDIVRDYSRYFVGRHYEEQFARGIFGLEMNWQGPLATNESVFETLKAFQEMERSATPQELLNWRFQQGLYRAYYDAYIKRRLSYETELRLLAVEALQSARNVGSPAAIERALSILERAERERVATDLRARVFEMAEALFQSIRMQLSVKKYQAIAVRRGANLDEIDRPFNLDLRAQLKEIQSLDSEELRLERIAAIPYTLPLSDEVSPYQHGTVIVDWSGEELPVPGKDR